MSADCFKLQKQINTWRRHFRILQEYEILLDAESKYKGQCHTNIKNKIAVIYDWDETELPPDYILHELLHICMRAIKSGRGFDRKKEESLIDDLCKLILKTQDLNKELTQ